MWLEKKKKFIEGVATCNKVDNEVFENILTRLYRVKPNEDEIKSIAGEHQNTKEILLIIKTLVYLVQRLHQFIMSPSKLQNDLINLGFSTDQAEIIVSLYSESNRGIISNLTDFESESRNVNWSIKTTLVDDTNLSLRCKKAVAQLSLNSDEGVSLIQDFDINSLGKLFSSFEDIQKELDQLQTNK